MNDMDTGYTPPLALTIISGICLAVGALCAIGIATDIVSRKGWQSMMGIMIPVYIINATYLGPFAVYIYYRFGRPAKPSEDTKGPSCHSQQRADVEKQVPSETSSQSTEVLEKPKESHCCHSKDIEEPPQEREPTVSSCHMKQNVTQHVKPSCHATGDVAQTEQPSTGHNKHACHSTSRPFWATVTSGVFHCGAGCVLGDLVGEWIVYGSGVTINGRMIWAELLLDYAFALLFGIGFQYFSIAPMSGQWGPITVWRAVKADVASLTSFEIGAFAWMIAFQVGIFNDKLDMMSWTYWWLMQVGMCLGVATAWPANWWLLRHGVKEACC